MLGSGASGSSSLLAHSADELYFGESLILGSSADVVLPASLPVYRNSLLDAADNTDAMKARLRTVLDALGLDATLADTATFSRDSADTISKTVSGIKESAEQNGWDADSSVLNYLSNVAQLQLNIPESDWPGGLTITVSNDLRTSVVCNLSLIHILGSFRLVAGNRHLHRYYNFAGRAVETVPRDVYKRQRRDLYAVRLLCGDARGAA